MFKSKWERGDSAETNDERPTQSVETESASQDKGKATMDQQKTNNITTVGDDTKFTGKIESRGTLRIDGRVEGEVVAQDSVIVGPSGVVKANLNAASISVSGQVDGNIMATKKIELHPTAVVKGDIRTGVGSLTIEAGARIDGRCTMTDEKLTLEKPLGTPGEGPALVAPAQPSRPVEAARPATPPMAQPSAAPIKK